MKSNYIKIDKFLLDKEVSEYFSRYESRSPYLIMNSTTAKILCLHINLPGHKISNEELMEYQGNKILFDESLQIGEIDIR